MVAKQLHLFGGEQQNRKPDGIVYQVKENRWRAELFGGWYVAYGPTKKAAIRSVLQQYYREQEYHEGR